MKKITFTFLSFIIALSTVNAQKGINYSHVYGAGGKLQMCVDSSAKNVYYDNLFPNQPHTSFNYLPEVNNLSIRINFRKDINIQSFRYTILIDNKPLVVNEPISEAQLKDSHAGGDEEIFRSAILGTFNVKGKVITTLVYSIEKPQDIAKAVFYGKPIPKAQLKGFAKPTPVANGYSFGSLIDSKEKINLTLTKKDDELTIVKDRSDIDYLYYTTIKDKQSNKIIFKSMAWEYGGYIDGHEYLPHTKINKTVFKKSGDYEIVIQPLFSPWNISPKEMEKYTVRYTLAITLDQENYSKRELLIYAVVVALSIGLAFLVILYFIKKRNKKKLLENEQQKNTAKLQLSSIRSQLNPHFMFNALSGIQNLMNKNDIDNANQYLAKFARLTRNVLDDKELVSLSQEKTLLNDYLQMEQLRFGFKYEIKHSESPDLDITEIPAMLLQPFVENAVKHGISKRAADGKITITFARQKNDLVLTVNDNGNGFDTSKKNNGLGLQLSNNRIALLNDIYKENRFTLAIQSSQNGTEISLTLSDWL